MFRLWLIARREIVAYAGAASFWVALAMGPILMLATALITASMAPHARAPAPVVRIAAADADLAAAAGRALNAAGIPSILAEGAGPGPTVRIAADGPTRVSARFESGAPSGVAPLLDRELRLALQQRLLQTAPADLQARAREIEVAVARPAPPPARPALPADRIGRFGVAMLLWLTLVGALGMLLQAIVRERTQRALESLMSATRPIEIVGGKLMGVGLVSMVVLAAWLGAGALAAPLAGSAGGQVAGQVLAAAFGDPAQLAWSLLVYVLAFAMYGSGLLAVGAFARDVASAQNLSRPVFGVLLLVFFAALSQLGGSGALAPALVWAPPITPFALLLAAPGSLSLVEMIGGIAIMAGGAVLGLTVAARLLVAQLDGAGAARLTAGRLRAA